MAAAGVRIRQYGLTAVSLFRESKFSRFPRDLQHGVAFSTPVKCSGSLIDQNFVGVYNAIGFDYSSGVCTPSFTRLIDHSSASKNNTVVISRNPFAPIAPLRKLACPLNNKSSGRREVSTCPNSLKSDVLSVTDEEQPKEFLASCDTTLLAEWQLSAKQLSQIDTFVDLLLDWNQRMNLTAVTERDAVMERHILDSLALLPVIGHALFETGGFSGGQKSPTSMSPASDQSLTFLNSESSASPDSKNLEKVTAPLAKKGAGRKKNHSKSAAEDSKDVGLEGSSHRGGAKRVRVIDVGTGAGLPGLVFAIARPKWDLVLVESLRKRCTFLEEVVRVAGLSNVSVVWGRAEDVVRLPNMRASADVAVARAVADLRVLSELCIPYVRKGGLFVAPKGPTPEDEVAAALGAIETLGGRVLATEKVASSGPGGQRTAVVCLKEKSTPAKYPRRAGVPAKSPL